jgi:hypothetical protein
MDHMGVKVVTKNGFSTAAHATQLVRLKVVFGNRNPDGFSASMLGVAVWPGQHVYVKPDAAAHAKQTYTVDGIDFVLLPEQLIQLIDVERQDKP